MIPRKSDCWPKRNAKGAKDAEENAEEGWDQIIKPASARGGPLKRVSGFCSQESIAAPEGEGEDENGDAVGQTGEGADLPAFLVRGHPGDGIAEKEGHADEEQGSGEQAVGVDGDQQPGLGIFQEGGAEQRRGDHEAENAEGADGEEIPHAVADEDQGDRGRHLEEALGSVEFSQVHGEGTEFAQTGWGDEEPEPGEANSQEDLAELVIAGEFFQEALHRLRFQQHHGVKGDEKHGENQSGGKKRQVLVGVHWIHAAPELGGGGPGFKPHLVGGGFT